MRPPAGTTILWALVCASLVGECSAVFATSPKDEPPQYCTVFDHFTKSGGSSVKRQLIQSSVREGTRLPGLITGVLRTTPEIRLDTVHNASVIVGYGDMIRDALEDAGRECEYFTIMRHPIDRLVSAFYYCPTTHDVQNRPRKWCGDAEGQEETLEARLLDFARMSWGNRAYLMMMHAIICDPSFELCNSSRAKNMSLWPQNLETAEGQHIHDSIKRVLSTFTAVGIFEEWDLSMRLFDVRVRSPVRRWNSQVSVNTGSQPLHRQALLNWAYTDPELHSFLSADLLLYEFATAIFKQQTRASLGVHWE